MTGRVHSRPDVVIQEGDTWWRYLDPVREVVAHAPEHVAGALEEIETAVEEERLLAAGFMRYEAAAAFGLAVKEQHGGLPLLWFGLFRERVSVDAGPPPGEYEFGPWQAGLDAEDYIAAVEQIKAAIARGETYQANFTFPLKANFSGDVWSIYAQLNLAQRASYSAFLDLGRFVIVSASPELFFRLDGENLVSRPMKGTASRGLSAVADDQQIDWLFQSEKNRAENVMIVDMIRNDMGRVAEIGSVHVPTLFAVERYPTLLQMTSTVKARTKASFAEIMAAMFPCASITGAPKVSTMQILSSLERGPRGIYTGTIGHLLPGRQAQFNVAIRTVVLNRAAGTATYHVGSGVVWDSDARAEYEECLLKARVLSPDARPPYEFSLFESLRWTPADGYMLLERHLKRLAASATYFDFPFEELVAREQLAQLASTLEYPAKVRLMLDQFGQITTQADSLTTGARPLPLRVGLATQPVDSRNKWLYHKTTVRHMYDKARASRPDCDDVLLWNERGEVTESSVANVIVKLDGFWVTPPVNSGLLPGTVRAELLAKGEVEERTIPVEALDRATEIVLVNSVRGRMPVRLVDPVGVS